MTEIIFITWFLIIWLMVIAWFLSILKNNPGVIDVFWGCAIALAGLIYVNIGVSNTVKYVFQILLVIWAVRLSGYLLLTRVLPKRLDMRYEDISNNWKMSKYLGFFINFQFQGMLALIIATPFIFISKTSSFDTLSVIAIAIIVIGFIGESFADYQLHKFKKSGSKGVCDIGLWQYSRHPNYFFEWLIWLGFGIAALVSPLACVSLISPLLLLCLMLFITIPITERGSIKSRGDAYREYMKSTSIFIPMPPRREI